PLPVMRPMATDLTIKLNESEKSGLIRDLLNVATRNLFPQVPTTSPKTRQSALPTEATSPASLSTLTKTKRLVAPSERITPSWRPRSFVVIEKTRATNKNTDAAI